jgi:hypothetical protein
MSAVAQARPSTLQPFPLAEVLLRSARIVTMSRGQWDGLLADAYERGWILLELDENEKPIRAYRKQAVTR